MASEAELLREECNGEFLDGSIFRVKLHNFLTYSDAEFFPGPRLNLVLGPNGTGKSSIVCALCIGLAGSTKLLGRADKVGQFVRHEKNSAFTEIELFFRKGNVVIRRDITRDNKSTWKINSRDATLKQVLTFMKKSSIQIDNLCQFLPQDKVGEFSRMNNIQLLRATEAAINDGSMIKVHDEIIELMKSTEDHSRNLDSLKTNLDKKIAENEQLHREVVRLAEHKKKMDEIKLMKKKVCWLKFNELKEKLTDLKAMKTELKKQMTEIKDKDFKPIEALCEKLNEEKDAALEEVNRASAAKNKRIGEIQAIKAKMEKVEADEMEKLSSIRELANRHKELEKRMQNLQSNHDKLLNEHNELPSEVDLKEERKQLESKYNEINKKCSEISVQKETEKRDFMELKRELSRYEGRLQELDNVVTQQKNHLGKFDRDAVQALEWLEKNQSLLQRKVSGPIAMELSISNPLHAQYVEDTLPGWLMMAFVTECRADYDLLIDQLNNNPDTQRRLKIAVLNIENAQVTNRNREHQIDSNYGFECFLDECISTSSVVKEALCAHAGLHTVLVGSQRTENIINQGEIDLFSMLTTNKSSAAFVTPSKRYISQVSKYGDRNTTTRTNDLRPVRVLARMSKNGDDDDDVQRRELKEGCVSLGQRVIDVSKSIDQLKVDERSLSEEKHSLMQQLTHLKSQQKSHLRLTQKLKTSSQNIETCSRELTRDLDSQKSHLKTELQNLLMKRALLLDEKLKICQQQLLPKNRVELGLQLKQVQYQIRLEVLQKKKRTIQLQIQNIHKDYETLKRQLTDVAREATQCKRKAESEAPLTPELQETFRTFPDDLRELKSCISTTEATLAHFSGDFAVLETYEEQAKLIVHLQQELSLMQATQSEQNEQIEKIRDPWHESLKIVVAKIDASFKSFFKDINCVGEIALLDQDPDISKWGIERRAQFRANTKLSTMSAQEQSGGEKSVGTIMYLMALQNLTTCPFRVVDEINQGMDVYNERKVFRRITKSSCGGVLPQYFLITPKLITGLVYHPDTKVHFIFNGPFSLSQSECDMKEFLRRKKRPSNNVKEIRIKKQPKCY